MFIYTDALVGVILDDEIALFEAFAELGRNGVVILIFTAGDPLDGVVILF